MTIHHDEDNCQLCQSSLSASCCYGWVLMRGTFNRLKNDHNSYHFADDISKCIFLNQKSVIRKRLFGIFTVRRKWLHKHALFCKCKVSQCWMQRNLLLELCKRLNIVRKKHSQVFMSFMNFRCISSAIWSVKLPSLAVRGGTVGTFCIAVS